MPKEEYAAFEALNPFFEVVLRGLRGLVVERGTIVDAAGLRIQIDSANFKARKLHRSTDYWIMKESC
ncbi:MAG: hypothetical protein ABSG96_17755 [Terracidiphilus sp.]|jgi:hypothetical protein